MSRGLPEPIAPSVLADRYRAGDSFASIIDLGLNDIVRHYPQGGPQHERAIRYAIALGWNAARHLYRAPDTIPPLSSRKAGPA